MKDLRVTRCAVAFCLVALWASAAASAPPSTPPTSGAVSPAPDASARPGAPRRIQRLVVAEFERDEEVSPRTARIVVNNLVVELRKLSGFSVIGMDEVRTLMKAEANRQLAGCGEEGSCLSELADALGADVIVAGRIGVIDGATTLSLRRIDSARATVVGTFEERLVARRGEEMLAAVGPAVEKCFPEVPLRPGMTRGVAPEQLRVLNPPPLPPIATLGVGVAAVGVGVGAGLAAVLSVQALADADALLATGSGGQPVSGTALAHLEDNARVFGTGAVVAASVAGGLVVIVGVMALFTDWTGAAAEAP